MSTDLERHSAARPVDFTRGFARVWRFVATVRRNVETSWSFVVRRRRDRRFPIQPYDALQIANALALSATAFALLVILLDPYLPLWPSTLPRPVSGFFRFFTQFGEANWILIGAGLAIVVAHLLDPDALKPTERIRRAIRIYAAAYVFLAVAISGIIANLSKYIIGRARPKLFDGNGSFAFDFLSWNADWASIPSGHATTGFAFGVALALLFPRLFWVFLTLGFWIAASRPFIGVHYPSDMLVGGLLGSVTAWLVARAFARMRLIFGFDRDGNLVRRKGASGQLS
ncbi:MAG: phosphatase PAP2 family protein [Propylenella sp.]